MYKIKGGESFHLIALQSPVCGIVNLFKIGLVAECRIFGQLCNGSLGAVIPFACKKHGKESICGHGLRSGAGETFLESLCHAV